MMIASKDQKQGTIRLLESMEDLNAVFDLQLEVWGDEAGQALGPTTLLAALKVGAVLAGAFDSKSGAINGFVFGFAGLREGQPAHWSHMLAVRREARDSGLGLALKRFQRRRVRRQGIHEMRWTFDPLEARNAFFNLTRLGAEVESYQRDFYGESGAGRRSAGIGSDRLIVRWDLDRPIPLRSQPRRLEEGYREAPIWSPSEGYGDTVRLSGADRIRIEVPSAIQELKEQDANQALWWRRQQRQAFKGALEAGMVVAGVMREPRLPRLPRLPREISTAAETTDQTPNPDQLARERRTFYCLRSK